MRHPDYPRGFSSAMAKVYAAALLILLISIGARVVWWLIAPFLWMLLTIVVLGVVYLVIFRRLRR